MAEGAAIGALAVRIGADAAQLISEFGRAGKATSDLNSSLKTIKSSLQALGLTLSVGAITAYGKSVVNAADAIYKGAQAAGIGTAAFSEYSYAAAQSGVSAESLSASLSKLNRGIVESSNFTGTAAQAFLALGINARNSNGSLKSVDQVMGEVADKFANFKDGPEKSALAIEFFGKAGAQMIPMLNQGARGLKEMRDEAKALGASIDSETGKAAEQFNDNLTRLSTVTRGYANQLMKDLLPALTAVTDSMVISKKATGGYKDEISELAVWLQDTGLATFQVFAIVLANLSFMAKTAGNEIGGMAAQITALASLDLKGFNAISKAMHQDADKAKAELDAYEKKIMGVSIRDPQTGGAMDMGVGLDDVFNKKKKAPVIPKDEGDGVSRQIQEGVDEEQKMQMEAIAATVESRNRQLAIDKDFYDSTNKALIDNYDLEQEMAIKQGEILVAEEGSYFSQVMSLRSTLASQSVALENEAYERRLKQLENFSDSELKELGGRQAVIEEMEKEHQDALGRLRDNELARDKARRQSGLQGAEQAMNDLSGLMNTHSRQVFEIGKAAAIGQAAYKTGLAVIDAWQAGMSIGTWWAPAVAAAYAAAAALNGLNMINNLRSQTFGGGGGAPTPPGQGDSGVGAQPAAGSQQPANRGPDTIVQLVGGDSFSRKQVRDLVERINEGTRDGGRVLLS